jgi:hypothetical protein
MSIPDHHFRIAEIDVARNTTDDKIIGIFRFENTGPTKQGPVLLIIAEIHSTLYVYERLLDIINETAEQARHLVSGVDQDPVGRFEKLVQRLNEAVSSFAQSESTPLAWNRINILAMELSKGHMCLTGVGTLMNLFLQKQDDGSFRSFDLFGSLERPADLDPQKPFASLICGDMKPGDLLMAGSSNLDRFRTELRMKERLTTLPPVTAALEIRQDLEKRGVPDHFVAAIVTCHEAKTPAPAAFSIPQPNKTPPIPASTASIEKLLESEDDVKQNLSPVINPIGSIAGGTSFPDLLKKTRDAATQTIKNLTQRARRERSGDPVAMASLRGMNAGYGSIFTPKRKVMIGAGIAIIILVAVAGSWYSHSKKVAAEIATWNSTFDQATDNRNRAESDLIYGNETRARTEIATSQQLMSGLTTDTADRTAKINKLKQDLSDLNQKLKKVVNTENVTELTALSPSAADGQLVAPVLSKDTVYAADLSGAAIMKIDLTSKEVTRIPIPPGTGQIVGATEGTTSILFATQDGKLLALTKADDTLKPMTWQHAKSSSTQDIVLYSSKLYSLDPSHNQVWRTQNSGGGFSSEAAYIKATDASLQDAVSMAIDSNVYILKSDGTLLRFLSGGQEGFGLVSIDPPLRAASSVWTDMTSQFIYVTDPADKRVLVYDKNGALKAQITSSQFHTPRDISVDEANKRMVLVDGNRLLFIPMQ